MQDALQVGQGVVNRIDTLPGGSEGNGHLIDVMQEGWETVAGKFESIASLMQTAQARRHASRSRGNHRDAD